MYERHWQLTSKPFENTADVRFYVPAESHQGALLKLRYAVENRRGAALLAGTSGTGKTLLLQALSRQLPETFQPLVHVVFPQMPADQLLAYVAAELTGEAHAVTPSVQHSVRAMAGMLSKNSQQGKHAVVIIDEAHLVSDSDSLETLRLLLNFEHETQPAMTLLLAGQTAMLPTLDRVPELDERIGVKCLLKRFSPQESTTYIQHRLREAGAQREIFDTAAIETIHQLTQGIPRRINRLSDLALLIGFAEERTSIGAPQIESVAQELVSVAVE